MCHAAQSRDLENHLKTRLPESQMKLLLSVLRGQQRKTGCIQQCPSRSLAETGSLRNRTQNSLPLAASVSPSSAESCADNLSTKPDTSSALTFPFLTSRSRFTSCSEELALPLHQLRKAFPALTSCHPLRHLTFVPTPSVPLPPVPYALLT